MTLIDILVWSASFGIPISYILQIYSNYKHRETRDINIYGTIFADYAYFIYGIKSGLIGETAFLLKYGLSFVFCSVMIAQIIVYRRKKEEWHDDLNSFCAGKKKEGSMCLNEIEPSWNFCPDCGSKSS